MPLRIAAKMREPAEKEWFASTVKPLLTDSIEYVGELGPADKLALLGDASCLLNPICWPEPFGMVMIESLACGTPVVVTPCGAANEIVDDGVTGFVRSTEAGLTLGVQNASGSRPACVPRRRCRAVLGRTLRGRSCRVLRADHRAPLEAHDRTQSRRVGCMSVWEAPADGVAACRGVGNHARAREQLRDLWRDG